MFYKIFVRFIFIILSIANISFSQILSTNTIDDIKHNLTNADESTLVVFDCDEVLTRCADPALVVDNAKALNNCIKILSKDYPNEFKNLANYKMIVLNSCTPILVNSELPKVVTDLQNRNIKTVVLTAMKNKKINDKNFIDWRIESLKKLGFDFSKNLEHIKETQLLDGQDSPYYKSGIICSAPQKKSIALNLFLKHSKLSPKKIIFIDDSIKNLDDVKNWAKENNIEFVGIEYLEYKNIKLAYEFSKERTKFQLEHLLKNNEWLSVEKAELMLKSSKK